MDGVQIAMARAALRWTVAELASKSGVSESTLGRLEQGGEALASTERKIIAAFEAAGLVILPNGSASLDGGPGVRFRDRK